MAVFHTEEQDILRFFTRGKLDPGKTESSHCFFAGGRRTCLDTGEIFIDCTRMRVGTAFAKKIFYSRIETLRYMSIITASIYIIDF